MVLTTVALKATALGSEEDVRQYLKLNALPSAAEKQMFNRMINAATERVEVYCGRPFITRAITGFYDGTNHRRLYLRAHPVIAVTQIDHMDTQGNSVRTYTSTDMLVDLVHGIVILTNGATFSIGLRRWKVQYTASYSSLTTVPDDVVFGFYKLCAELWRSYQNRTDRITSQTIDGQTTFFEDKIMSNEVKAILKPRAIPAGMVGL